MDNKIFAYGYTAHQSWAFDKTLLDSNLSFPCESKYLEYAQEYLEYQIANARKMTNDIRTELNEMKIKNPELA